MKAHHLIDKELYEIREIEDGEEVRIENSPLFKRFVGGIGWLNPQEHDSFATNWLVIIGEDESGCYHAIAEVPGDLMVIAEETVNWKDRLLIDRFYLDDDDAAAVLKLRTYDGLTHYKSDGKDNFGKKKYVHKPDFWPEFRKERPIAAVIGVPPEIKMNVLTGYQLMISLMAKGKMVLLHRCVQLATWLKEPPPVKRIIEHPVIKAASYAIMMMERTKKRETDQRGSYSPYGNLRS